MVRANNYLGVSHGMVNLRGYQSDLKGRTQEKWREGFRVVMGVLPTGAGKTEVAGAVAEEHDGWGCAIAHRAELVGQISRALAKRGIVHKIIAAESTRKTIQRDHYSKFGRSFINNNKADWAVASIDTIIRHSGEEHFKRATLAFEDEGHHALKANKWGKVFGMFSPTCNGLLLTATPIRGDGCGLGSDTDGIADALICGPQMRWMINNGYLTDYEFFSPEVKDLDLSKVRVTANGELSEHEVAEAISKCPQIVGDVVEHYLAHAGGKLGITFAININEANKIAAEFNARGVPAVVVHGGNTAEERRVALERFERRELLQLVNVDLFGEGFDLPAIEVVSMARPTASLGLYMQQWGRALRLMISPILQAAWDTYSPAQRLAFIAASEKPRATIIDHVGNYYRHRGPADKERVWSLAPSKNKSVGPSDEIPTRSCGACFKPYMRIYNVCTWCGTPQPLPEPSDRSSPTAVEGDLVRMSEEQLAKDRGAAAAVTRSTGLVPQNLKGTPAESRIIRNHNDRLRAQHNLRYVIDCWAGCYPGEDERTLHRRFFHMFGHGVLQACALNTADANELRGRITESMRLACTIINGLPFPDTNNAAA